MDSGSDASEETVRRCDGCPYPDMPCLERGEPCDWLARRLPPRRPTPQLRTPRQIAHFLDRRARTRFILEHAHLATPRQQQVIQLFFRENHTHAQIAQVLGIARATSEQTLWRSYARLLDKAARV